MKFGLDELIFKDVSSLNISFKALSIKIATALVKRFQSAESSKGTFSRDIKPPILSNQ
jgi:hypothetical protein